MDCIGNSGAMRMVLVMAMFVLAIGLAPCALGQVSLTLDAVEQACAGGVDVALTVSGATDLVAFGMELTYDAGNLSFVSVSKGALCADWASVSAYEATAGTVVIGGYKGSGTAVNGVGEALQIHFTCAACPSSTALILSDLVDGFVGAMVTPGLAVCSEPPAIVTQPESQTVTVGDAVSFSVVATGSSPMVYAWSKEGAPLPDEFGATLVLDDVQLGDSGAYSCEVANNVGSDESTDALLEVNKAVPASETAGQIVLVVSCGLAGIALLRFRRRKLPHA
jgi:Ig-like domain-containing protein/cohesin domain-containing protein